VTVDADPNYILGGAFYNTADRTYAMNTYLRGAWPSGSPARYRNRLNEVTISQNVILWADATRARFGNYGGDWGPNCQRHGTATKDGISAPQDGGSGANVAFVDGHAEWMTAEKYVNWRVSGYPAQRPYAWY